MQRWEENIRKTLPYVPGKQSARPGLIKLNTNENPYPPSPEVSRILSEYNYMDFVKYPEPNVSVLKEALAAYHEVESERIFVGVGSDDVLAMAFLTFFNGTSPILFPDITYSFYDVWAGYFQIPYETVPLSPDFHIDIDDYKKKNGGIVIANPNAPTGCVIPVSRIEELVKHNTDSVVIIDEAYVDFGADSAVGLTDKYENLIVTRTFSKSRALAGNRIGYAIGSKKLINYLWAARNSFNSYTINNLSASIAVASIEDDIYFRMRLKDVVETREVFKEEMGKLGFGFPDSYANFLFVKHADKMAIDIFDYLDKKNIMVRHFNRPGIENFLRISIGTKEQMNTLVTTLSEYV